MQKALLRKRVLLLFANTRFWAGLSIIVSMLSLVFPWWEIEIRTSFSWGVFWGPPLSNTTPVVFFPDRLGAQFSANYSFFTALVALTILLTAIAGLLRRSLLYLIAFLSSIVTVLFFITDASYALNSECEQISIEGATCISGLVGVGRTGTGSFLFWGFKTGFYLFIGSAVLILAAFLLHRHHE